MMLDFGYRWTDWRDALWVLNRIEGCDIFFAEATLQHDDLDVEHLAPSLFDSPLRQELTRPEPVLEEGTAPLPTEPGLGIEVAEEALSKYRTEPAAP